MKETVTISVNKENSDKIISYYSKNRVSNKGEYIAFQAKLNDLVITIYTSKKEDIFKVVFMGNEALKEARVWDANADTTVAKEKIKEEWICFENQIGSDEVGVGDFLAPMIVVAAFVSSNNISYLINLGIHDSKKLTDEQILKLGPIVSSKFKYSKLTLPNYRYNEMIQKGENLNSLKAKMHNRALLNMHKSFPDVINIFVDQFVEEKTYYKYLDDTSEEQVKGIYFKTKGESYFPCVALASVIARYSFLKEIEKLNEKYQMNIPLGASNRVNEFAKEFIARYGKEEFDKIAKKNFANYHEVTSINLID